MTRKASWRALATAGLTIATFLTGAFPCMAGARAAEREAPIALREFVPVGSSTRVHTELKAKGLYRPGLPPGDTTRDAKMPKPLSVEIETRFVFHERVLEVDRGERSGSRRGGGLASAGDRSAAGRPQKTVRHVIQAASAINGEVRPISALIRPELRLLVAERRERDGPVVVVSPAGPLTWYELELVQGLGDSLCLADLLPDEPARVGERWRVHDSAAKGLSEYDRITSNSLEATLEVADAARAKIRLKGQIQGSVRGGPGKMTCDGFFTFDRSASRVDHLEMSRTESRQAGPVEAGLDLKSTLVVNREAADLPPTLSDKALAGLPLDVTPARELLRLNAPGAKGALLHDRHWHMFWEDPKLIVLKRLKDGQVIAQCNLMVGPDAGKDRHQDPTQFRDDIKRGLKNRFVQFLGAGEVDGHPAGGFRYKVAVQGREGRLGIVWYYYLIASPEGEQLMATFTMAEDHVKVFGNQDLEMIGSFEWLKRPPIESSQ